MRAYVDSGVLVKLYVREPNSAAAAAAVSKFPSVTLNALQELELRNTLRALEGRCVIGSAQRAASEHVLDADIVSQRLRRTTPDWTEAFRIAVRLSSEHTAETLARSLDALHVGIAVAQAADVFVTADARQEVVAKRAGLATHMVA